MFARFRFSLILSRSLFLSLVAPFWAVSASHADNTPRVLTMAGVADFYVPDILSALEKELNARIVFETFEDTQSTISAIAQSRISPDIIFAEALFRHDARLEKLGRTTTVSNVPNLKRIRPQLLEASNSNVSAGIIEMPFQWYTLGVLWNKNAITLNVPANNRFSIQDVTKADVLNAKSACKIGVVNHPQVISTLLEQATWFDWRVSPENNDAHIANSKALWISKLRPALIRQPQERLLRNFVRQDVCAVVTYSYDVNAMQRLHLYKDDFASNFDFVEFSSPTPILVDRVVINKKSNNPDLAFRAVDWLLADESQSKIAGYLGTRPVTSAIRFSDAEKGLPKGNEKRVDAPGTSFFYAAKASAGRATSNGEKVMHSFNAGWTSIPLAK